MAKASWAAELKPNYCHISNSSYSMCPAPAKPDLTSAQAILPCPFCTSWCKGVTYTSASTIRLFPWPPTGQEDYTNTVQRGHFPCTSLRPAVDTLRVVLTSWCETKPLCGSGSHKGQLCHRTGSPMPWQDLQDRGWPARAQSHSRQPRQAGDGSQDQPGAQSTRKLQRDEAGLRPSWGSSPEVGSCNGNWGQTQGLPGRPKERQERQTRSQPRATAASNKHISGGA